MTLRLRSRALACLLLAALILGGCDLAAFPVGAPAPAVLPTPVRPVEARVAYVIDGDSIAVDIDGRRFQVRYIGVDTPELHDENTGNAQPGAQEAANANRALVSNRIVRLEKDVSETDRYGRLLRYVWVGEAMVNAELVRQGYAQVSSFPPDVRHIPLFLQLQAEAQQARRGLWAAR
ncbi:MAG: thermonuclease family protein [Anaerolineae bacterium]|jgi:micrococcal nuclease|nr:thermonuclease family protein [Anaerolineae bacterium]